jgi:hypothetical protein
MAEQDKEALAAKLEAYWSWAEDDDAVAGFIPWHWPDLSDAFKPTSMVLGAEAFPTLRAKVAELWWARSAARMARSRRHDCEPFTK